MTIRKGVLATLLLALFATVRLEAQRMALRTNLLALATGNINIEGSMYLSPRLSLHLPLQAKPFSYPLPLPIGALRYLEREGTSQDATAFGTVQHSENYTVQPGLRYWMGGVYNRGFFFGAYAIATWFRWGGDKFDANYREGYGLGAGLSLGYSYELSPRWNLEAEIGVGALWRDYERINAQSERAYSKERDTRLTIPRIGVSLVYLLK